MDHKKVWVKKFFVVPIKILGPKKSWVQNNFGSENIVVQNSFFGKNHLGVANIFLVCSVIVDFVGILLVVLVLLVTWVIRTPNLLNSAKSP